MPPVGALQFRRLRVWSSDCPPCSQQPTQQSLSSALPHIGHLWSTFKPKPPPNSSILADTSTMATSIFRQALPSTVREIRLHFSPTQANEVKSFIHSNYSSIKSSNPDLPILFRESFVGTPARAIVRFEYGVEKQVSLEQAKSSSEIESLLSDLIQGKN
ncbi:hypothetical protein PSTT_09191, partial [Puccinia striiformis]